MKGDKSNHKSVFLAAITASVVTLTFGFTYHTLAERLAVPVNIIQIVPEALEKLPLEITDWTGEDLPMDEAILRATGTDAHINRYYSRKNGLESVSLFVGCSVSVSDRVVHRPEICYMRSGWTLMNRWSAELSLDSGMKLPYSIFQFSRGDLKGQESMVLHYYIVDGQYYEEVTPLQVKLWHLGAGANYIARIMIVAPVRNSNADLARRIVSSFAVDSASSIAVLFDSIQKEQSAQATGPLKKEGSRQ